MLSPTPWRKKKARVADAPLRKQRAPRRKRMLKELPPLDWMMEDSHSANNVPGKSPAPPAVEPRAVHEELNDEPRVAPEEAHAEELKEATPEPPVAMWQLREPASTDSPVWGTCLRRCWSAAAVCVVGWLLARPRDFIICPFDRVRVL